MPSPTSVLVAGGRLGGRLARDLAATVNEEQTSGEADLAVDTDEDAICRQFLTFGRRILRRALEDERIVSSAGAWRTPAVPVSE